MKCSNFSTVNSVSQFSMKSDARSGELYGGNKIRKLEFLLPDIIASKADTVTVAAATSSNFAKAIFLYCKEYGIKNEFIFCDLSGKCPEIDKEFLDGDCRCYLVTKPTFAAAAMVLNNQKISKLLNIAQGARYIVPSGGSSLIGCLGYVAAAIEFSDQILQSKIEDVVTLFVPVGSGGMITGLAAAFMLLETNINLIGISVAPSHNRRKILKQIKELQIFLGFENEIKLPNSTQLQIRNDFLGGGYGKSLVGAELLQMSMLETENIYVDQTYSAKALHGMLEILREQPDLSNPIFWHTYSDPTFYPW